MPSGKIDISIINTILKTQFLSYMSTHLASVSTESEGRFLDITPINVSKEDLESLREFMKSPKASDWVKDNRMKRLVGSWCILCGGIPTKIASYDYNGATRIERYCETCAEKQFSCTQKGQADGGRDGAD
jgi:hypothetical protein